MTLSLSGSPSRSLIFLIFSIEIARETVAFLSEHLFRETTSSWFYAELKETTPATIFPLLVLIETERSIYMDTGVHCIPCRFKSCCYRLLPEWIRRFLKLDTSRWREGTFCSSPDKCELGRKGNTIFEGERELSWKPNVKFDLLNQDCRLHFVEFHGSNN